MSHDPLDIEVIIPGLPRPSGPEITESYVDQLVAALEEIISVLNSTRQRNFTEINLTNTKTNGSGLRIGDVVVDSGILNIVRAGVGYAETFSATGSVGTVTVSTS